MFGVMAGDLVGFPHEYRHVDLTDRSIKLFPETDSGQAGTDFSDRTVLAAAMEEGLLRFERKLPEILAAGRGRTEDSAARDENRQRVSSSLFEETFCGTLTDALREYGRKYPLAGYSMDMSIWLFREGAALSEEDEAGPASRAVSIAWLFQEDLYMMRHLARLQARCTHRNAGAIRAADAAACAVFLALHGQTKEYISQYLERGFGFNVVNEAAMRRELLLAGAAQQTGGGAMGAGAGDERPEQSLSSLCVRAALTAFLYGQDFEDVLRRAVSMGGRSSDIASLAGGMAEAYFGMPEQVRSECCSRLPADLSAAAEAFSARMDRKREKRMSSPAAQSQWENALTRASDRHPAAVQGNEKLEEAIEAFNTKKDQQSFLTALEILRLRMNRKGRVLVPVVSAGRTENGPVEGTPAVKSSAVKTPAERTPAERSSAGKMPAEGTSAVRTGAGTEGESSLNSNSSPNTVSYRMQAVRTKDGKLWQPAYTCRAQMDRAKAAVNAGAAGLSSELALSYAMEALFKRFLPVQEAEPDLQQGPGSSAPPAAAAVPAAIEGIVLNPCGTAFFLPRKTIEALFALNREKGSGPQ